MMHGTIVNSKNLSIIIHCKRKTLHSRFFYWLEVVKQILQLNELERVGFSGL